MNDDFEDQIRRQTMRHLPPEWRREILGKSRNAARDGAIQPKPFIQKLRAMLWPHPFAWAALAATWIAILALNFASRDRSILVSTHQPVPSSPELREMIREQKQLLAELIGDPPHPSHTEPTSPRPQSRSRNEFWYV